MNKTLKKTLKGLKPPKVPDRVKLLSLLAIILVVGAPALVSIIDDSMNVDYLADTVLYDTDHSVLSKALGPDNPAVDIVYLSATDNAGVNVISLIDNGDLAVIDRYRFIGFDMEPIKSGASIISVTLNVETTSAVKFATNAPAGTTPIYRSMTQSETDPYTWTVDLTSVEIAKFKSDVYNYIYFTVPCNEAYVELQATAYTFTTVPYGEIIIGATGAVLLLCALLATPYFGVFKKKGVKS